MDNSRYIVQVFVGSLSPLYEALTIEASKQTTADEIVSCITERLKLRTPHHYELAEVIGNAGGQECKERRLGNHENPVAVQMLWPKFLPPPSGGHSDVNGESFQAPEYRFCLREKMSELGTNRGTSWPDGADSQLIRDYFLRFLYQPRDKEYPDLCQLPDLNEKTLLQNLKARFHSGHIYTYVGSILIAVNPFKFYPIYNPKYVKLYQNRRLGELPPHIFAIADAAYHTMLRERRNQCIVISGESGSGKTESTNFLLHHLTALSQKGTHGSGVEQTILSAGPVLEAFGNAKTAHNNNSSRFGKFIQVNYRENGMVQGAVVQKYLLEKSRIVSQAKNERNYHVFYYLLAGASEKERANLNLGEPKDYHYLNQSDCYTLDGVDESYEFSRLKQSMEMVGFSPEKQKRLFCVLSALLHLGNVEFVKKSTYHHDEAVWVKNPELVALISQLLRVKEETLMSALTSKRAKASGETLVMNYKLPEAIAARDALAKGLYGALFDWIVMQVNHALLAKKDTSKEHQGNSIGVLDIFGFEDFGQSNSFEQFCINFANEHLQFYFNQHVFKYEQEEYKREGIQWTNIEFIDNTGCLQLIEGKPNGLLCVLDDQCNFPGATNETLLQKFHNEHKDTQFYEVPQKRENAFIINHYAGKVKYQVKDFREKNLDLMRPDIVSVLKNSSMAFVRELVGADPVAVFRWAILRAFFRAYFAFIQAGQRYRNAEGGSDRGLKKAVAYHSRRHTQMESVMSSVVGVASVSLTVHSIIPPKYLNRKTSRHSMHDLHESSSSALSRTPVVTGVHPDASSVLDTPRLNVNEARVLQRANRILNKNKSFRPRSKSAKGIKNLQSVKTLACRTQLNSPNGALGRATRKQPLTVTAQFQVSLCQLMETLSQASPFFVRCIKSNADKIANRFDEDIILRQLRYTGMLETVRIRQSGYNVRLTFEANKREKNGRNNAISKVTIFRNSAFGSNNLGERTGVSEFIEHYRILLQKGLLSSQADVKDFLLNMNLNGENYQIGRTKVFLRESEKMKLDFRLHQAILERIVVIQRWYRTILERRTFLRIQAAVVRLQAHTRRYLAQKCVATLRLRHYAAVVIQKCWRGYIARCQYQQLRRGVVAVQSCIRGNRARERFKQMAAERQERLKQQTELVEIHSQNDEAFLSKESSQEELENDHLYGNSDAVQEHRDSEESSGIQEDSEVESVVLEHAHPIVTTTPPISPTSSYDIPYSPVSLDIEETSLKDREKGPKDASTLSMDERKTKLPKKISLKRSRSAKASLSNDVPSSADNKNEKQAKVRTSPDVDWPISFRRSSKTDLKAKDLSRDSDDIKALDQSQPKGAFDKAKKRFKTIVMGKKRNSHDESDDSGSEELSSTIYSCQTSLDSGSKTPDDSIVSDSRLFDDQSTFEQSTDSMDREKSVDSYQHHFKSTTRFSRGETCTYCEKGMSSFFANGYRCVDCKQVFHPKCAHFANKYVCQLVVQRRSPNGRRRSRRPTITRIETPSSWNVTRTSEFTDKTDQVICDVKELQSMDKFIFQKICQMAGDDGGKRDTIVDKTFKRALKEFQTYLISTYSIAVQDGHLSLRYKDLITNFEQVMENVCRQENTTAAFPVTMGVNAFRGFVNEFMSQNRRPPEEKKETKVKPQKEKRPQKDKRRKDQVVAHQLGHCFTAVVVNIPTICEVCSSFMWMLEKGLVCQNCKLTCHRKCCNRITYYCKEEVDVCYPEGKVFGAKLSSLLPDDLKIPLVVELLITTIELKGLYTEGIYRKSGASSKVKMLKLAIENEGENVCLDGYAVHVLTSTLKTFFREMPDPLMTFDAYDDFIRATEVSDPQERISTLFNIISKLPRAHFDLLERLVFHLSRVAQQEEYNRMSPNALAIVFAPCILRTNKNVNAQDSLNDVNKQTTCIEYIIHEQLRKVKTTLDDIFTLDTACHTANNRLSSIRSSKVNLPKMYLPQGEDASMSSEVGDDEEELLTQHIATLQNEKALLTTTLPSLVRTSSDDDMLSTDVESTVGSLDDINRPPYEEYALTFDLPVAPPSLQHLTKHRAGLSKKRRQPPSRFALVNSKALNFGEKGSQSSAADTSIISLYPLMNIEYKDDAIMV